MQTSEKKGSKLLLFVLVLATAAFILSSSISIPLWCKPFYYLQMDNLGVEDYSGYSEETIRQAYSDIVDYCNGRLPEFAVGELGYSEEGKGHFTDCRTLFLLDYKVLVVSSAVILLYLILKKAAGIRAARPAKLGAGFWGALLTLVLGGLLGGLGSIDFDKTFVIFHKIFFPGKNNWLFDWHTDPVILILPENFFMRCAILIVGMILLECVILMIADSRRKRKA